VATRKGFDQAWFRIVRMAGQNKESAITASVLLYAGLYILVGIGGINFQVQPALGYVDVGSIANSNPRAGSAWVEGESLHWADGSTEYFTTQGSIPLSVWDFSQGSGTAVDKYGNNDGNLESGASIVSGGYYSNGVSFGGTSGEGIDYGHLWDDHTQSRTFSFWFQESGSSSGDRIISQDCSEWFCVIDAGSGGIRVLAAGSAYDKTFSVSETSWNHVAVSFNEKSSTLRVFLDGSQVDSYSYSSGWSHGARPVVLAGNTEGYNDISGDQWEGTVDEFKMYRGVLNQNQVQEMYNKGRDRFRSIKGNYHFDSGSGSTAQDSSGWGNDLSITGATWTSGKRDDALSFDGTDDYAEMSSPPDITSGDESMAVTFWLNPVSGSGTNAIAEWDNGAHIWQYNSESDLFLNPRGTCDSFEASGAINLDQWSHYAVVYDGAANEFRAYVDGSLVKTSSQNCDVDTASSTLRLANRVGGDRYLNGKLDEVKIYSRALSQERIRRLYEGSGSRPNGPTGSAWIEGDYLRFIDQNGFERVYRASNTGANPSGASAGNLWMEGGNLNYIDVSGNERATYPRSCRTVKGGSGTYTIDPDGGGGVNAFQVDCVMNENGAGWIKLSMSNAGSDNVWSASYSGSNNIYKCGVDEAKYYNGRTSIGEDWVPGATDVTNTYNVDYNTAGSTLTEAQESAIRDIVTRLSSTTRSVGFTCDDDGGSANDHDAYLRDESEAEWNSQDGYVDGSNYEGWWLHDVNSASNYFETSNTFSGQNTNRALLRGHIIPAEIKLEIGSGGGTAWGYEKNYFLVK